MPEDPYSGHYFVVEVNNQPLAAFTECTLPTLEFDVVEQKEGGLNDYIHVLPGQRKSGRVTLKRGLTKNKELLKWYLDLLQGNVTKARRSLTIIMNDSLGNEVARWNFMEAMPVKWTGPQLKADQGAVAIESIELVVHDYIP